MTTSLAPGSRFGAYGVGRLLGRGAMGVVYEATHLALERQVALKVLAPDLASDPDFQERFRREAAIVARLDSPHIVTVYDAGEVDGRLFIASRLVPGQDLGQVLRERGGLPPAEALDLVRQTLVALRSAHGAGVVHRDVKPGNALVHRRPDGSTRLLLCDFGIARSLEETGLTRETAAIGTWEYLAPERHDGRPADARTDLYACGCLLWACLSGAPPWRGTGVQVALAHRDAPVPQLNDGGVPARVVNQILAMAMAKDPGHRYQTADEMLAEVESAQIICERFAP